MTRLSELEKGVGGVDSYIERSRGGGGTRSTGGAFTKRPKTQNSSTNSDEERSRGKTRRSTREAAENTKEETRRRSAHEVGTQKRRQTRPKRNAA